ncbi:MAG: hypothetical protein IPK35_20095 [Saprospiraceae bacterium]|nr:hypothetical protein [Saprospiraceae bacterium]
MSTIPFIHNYCDRWCEKCRFVQQCAVGLEETRMTEDQKNINKEAFWSNISDQFTKAKTLLEKYIAENDIAKNEFGNQEVEHKHQKKKKRVTDDIIAQLSKSYITIADKIDLTDLFKFYKTELEKNMSIGIISQVSFMDELQKIKDSIDTINWFKYFIHVKLVRAISSREDNDENDLQSDHNGSAKIVLLAIESSIGAWHSLYDVAEDRKEVILDVMALLSKLRRLTNETFPEAMQFVRPGFDDGWEAIWEVD